MTGEWRQRVWNLFDRAADLSPSERAAFLDDACGGDPGLRAEVESLLAHDVTSASQGRGGLFESPLGRRQWESTLLPTESPPVEAPALPPRVGRYRVLRLLGEGGMGVVYEAEQDSPRRRVALKVVRPGLVTPALLKRFAHEAQILGRLRHPGIAQIYEAGQSEYGQPFFAMEFIHGDPLDEHARRHGLGPAARLELLARVCDAVQHAHEQGVVHRDLKPGNILVDEAGQPRILDFGVARGTDADLLISTAHTQPGQLVGTLSYMSPEQVAADPAGVDGRSDVYTLGVILHELLAGRLPYPLEHLPLPELARVIREQEPSRLGSIDTRFRGDVETIAAKALEKDRARRYQSAADLAADIRRHLRNEPIRARPVSSATRLARWCRRRPGTAALLAALALVILTSLVLVTWKWREAEDTARREILARQEAEEHRQEARRSLYRANVRLAMQAWNGNQVEHMFALLEEAAQGHPGDEDLRGFEWYYLQRLGHPKVRTLRAPPGEGVAFSPDGRRLASAGHDGTVRVWDTVTGKELFALRGHTRRVIGVAFSPDGRLLASGGDDHTARVWDTNTGREVHELRRHTNDVRAVAFSPDGRWLASASSDHAVRFWEAATGREELPPIRPHDGAVMGVAFSPDGRRLALAYGKDRVSVCEVATRKELLVLTPKQTGWITGVALTPDGRRMAVGSDDRAVHVWEAETGKELLTLKGHDDTVTGVAFSPDGRRLASVSRDGTARVWDAATGRELLALKGHTNWVMGVAFSPDGRRLATASLDGTVRLWETDAEHPTVTVHPEEVRGVAFSPDGRRLASAGQDGVVRVWEAASDKEPLSLKGHDSWLNGVAFSADGRRLASVSRDGTVRVWEADTGRELRVLKGHTDWTLAAAFRPDGRWLASAGRDRTVRLWDTDTGREVLALKGHAGEVAGVAFSPDGRCLASGSMDQTVRLWEMETGRELRVLRGHTASVTGVNGVAFSRDGRRLASAAGDQTVRLWDADTGKELLILKGHASLVQGVAFSPDGRRVASAGADCTVRLWEADTGKELLALRGHTGRVTGVAFSPDGQRLVSSSEDRTVRLWEAGGRPAETLPQRAGAEPRP